jgi:hypothetical protein
MTADERSCSMTETSKKLIQQVEKILDEGEGEERSVIVQMSSPDEKKKDLMVRTASEVIQKRHLTLTPRDLLPASLDQMRRGRAGKPTPAARRQLLTVEKSFSAQMAAIALPALTKATLEAVGLRALAPLLDSPLVREAALAVAELWTSRSAVLKMKRDDLKRLPDEVPQIRDIHPNRILRTPPLVEVKNLPTAILENKASSWGGTCNWRLGGLGGVRHTRSRYHDRIVGYRGGS